MKTLQAHFTEHDLSKELLWYGTIHKGQCYEQEETGMGTIG